MTRSSLQLGVTTVLALILTSAAHAGFILDDNYAECMSSNLSGTSYRDPNLSYKRAAAKKRCFAKFCKGKSRQVHDSDCEREKSVYYSRHAKLKSELEAVNDALQNTNHTEREKYINLLSRSILIQRRIDGESLPPVCFDRVIYQDETCPAY